MRRNVKDIKLLETIARMRKIIRRKHQALKMGKMIDENILQETLKPVTEPLEQISKKIRAKPDKNDGKLLETVGEEEEFSTPLLSQQPKMEKKIDISTTPLTTRQRRQLRRSKLHDSTSESFSPQDGKSPPASNNVHLSKSLKDIFEDTISSKDIDSKYGIRYDAVADSLKIGNTNISIDGDNLFLKDKTHHLTPGLYKLIVLRDPKSDMYTENDLEVYGEILSNTNAYRRNYDPNQPIRAGRSNKYKNIIKNLISRHSGKSLMELPKNADYVYWDDVNELVDRLRLLIASQQAGHSNHNNEIISIIGELREANIIE